MTFYRLIDHTADLGIRVTDKNLPDLFVKAATAMFDLICQKPGFADFVSASVRVEGDDLEDLMVNWLRELLYLYNGRQKLLDAVESFDLDVKRLKIDAQLRMGCFNLKTHQIWHEIKAVTYHQMEVKSGKNGWETTIVFDV